MTSNDGVTFDISDDNGDTTGSVAFHLTTAVGDFTVNGVPADDEVTLFDADGNEVGPRRLLAPPLPSANLLTGIHRFRSGLSTDVRHLRRTTRSLTFGMWSPTVTCSS